MKALKKKQMKRTEKELQKLVTEKEGEIKMKNK